MKNTYLFSRKEMTPVAFSRNDSGVISTYMQLVKKNTLCSGLKNYIKILLFMRCEQN